MKPDHSLTPPTRSNSKRIKGLNVRTETIKPMGENIDDKLPDIGLSTDTQSKDNESKKIKKWDYIVQKGFRTAKEVFNKMKTQPVKRERIFAHQISDKELRSKI